MSCRALPSIPFSTFRIPRPALCAALLLALVTAGAATAAPVELTETQKLASPGGDTFNTFGASVALRGDLAIVGAPNEEIDGVHGAGTFSIFRSGPTGWSLEAWLHLDSPAQFTNTGSAVGLAAGEAFIGSSGYPGATELDGRVFTWTEGGGAWIPEGDFAGDDTDDADQFGYSLAVDGDALLVGAPLRSDTSTREGAAYLFRRMGGTWVQEQRFASPSTSFEGAFGSDVALDGDTAVVASPGAEVDGTEGAGAVFVFTSDGGGWILEATLVAPDIAGRDLFGWSVSLEGDILAIGAIGHPGPGTQTGAGTVYVFVRDRGAWILEEEISGVDAGASGFFGSDVALRGDHLLVGASNAGNVTFADGVALLYRREASEWTPVARLVASDGFINSNLGRALALDGTTAILGAPGGATSAAYVYDLTAFLGPNAEALEQLEALADRIVEMGLPAGIEQSFLAKAAASIRALSDDGGVNDGAAVRILGALGRQIDAQDGRRLTHGEASELRSLVAEILALLGGELEPGFGILPEGTFRARGAMGR